MSAACNETPTKGQWGTMNVFDSLRTLWSSADEPEASHLKKQQKALRRAWGFEDDDPVFADDSRELRAIAPESSSDVTRLDHKIWQSKMFRIAEEAREHALTDPSEEIRELMIDRISLGISDESAEATACTVLETAVRQVVADRHISLAEVAYLDSLRKALALSEETVSEIVRDVVTEAEAVFGAKIEGFVPFFACEHDSGEEIAASESSFS